MSTDAPTVGLALIVKNEADTLPRLLESIQGAFDRVVMVDTGSTDDTVNVFCDWCLDEQTRQGRAFTWLVGEFEWVDDFAAARRHADSLLDTDYRVWADADDTIVGAGHLRGLAARCEQSGLAALVANYHYAHDQHGNVICTLKRERLVKAGLGHWTGRVHEAQELHGPNALLDPDLVRWVHHKPWTGEGSSQRNLRILKAWARDEPSNPRVLAYLGTELAAIGKHHLALRHYRAYLRLKTNWDEERAQVHRKLSASLMALDKPQDALEVALAALAVIPDWPDTHLSLAQACYQLGEYEKAIKWAREVLRLGQPDSLLILNPTDYTVAPRVVLAASLGALGRVDEALGMAREVLEVIPDHEQLRQHARGWEKASEREHVAQTFAGIARLLITHDEQLKARRLLEDCVPYFAQDHPDVVAARSLVRERLMWLDSPAEYARHYREGGSKAEDFHTDEQAFEVCANLPRAAFLARAINELKEAA